MGSLQYISPFDVKRIAHLAQLADAVALFRPLYALGYIATLKQEFGLTMTRPLPRVEHGTATYQQQLDEVRAGIDDARAARKPFIAGRPSNSGNNLQAAA